MRKLDIADPEIMRIAIQHEIARSDESRYDHRLHGLLLFTRGQSCQQIADLFGEDRLAWMPSSGLRWNETCAVAPVISVMLVTCGTASCCPHTSRSATRSLWAYVNVSASSDKWGFACVSRDHKWLRLTRCRWGRFAYSLCETFDAKTFETFLKMLLRQRTRGKRMVIVLDNVRYHHATLLAPLLQKHLKELTLLFLPPYSPQLAPIERVWKLTRRLATHNRYFETLGEVLEDVQKYFARWQQMNMLLTGLRGIT